MESINPHAVVQKVHLPKNGLKLKMPFSLMVSGPSQSGKSQWICKLIEQRAQIFETEFDQIIYCQPELLAHRPNEIFNRILKSFPTAMLLSGLPNIAKLHLNIGRGRPVLLIIDDQMNAFLSSEAMLHLLTVGVHHHDVNVIFTVQNYFSASKFGKTMTRNSIYKTFFFNRTDLTELRHISTQIVAKSPNFLKSCFDFLMKKFPQDQSHYVFVDGHYRSNVPNFFVRSKIFPDEDGVIRPIIFFPK